MLVIRVPTVARAGLLGVALAAIAPPAPVTATGLLDDGSEPWLRRNLGSAYFRHDRFADASRELARAAELAPFEAADARNAGIAALLAGDLGAARTALLRSSELAPSSAATAYAIGILEKRSGHPEDAWRALERCRELGGRGPELAYNLGLLAARLGDLESAERSFREVVAAGPQAAPLHYAPALYRHARTLLALGRREEGESLLGLARAVARDAREAPSTRADLDRGALLELTEIEWEPDLRSAGPLPVFAPDSLVPGDIRWVECADADGDGDRDLLLGDGQTLRDLRWENGTWVDVTSSRGLAGLLGVGSARVLDVDGDGTPDLVRGGGGGIHLHPGVAGAWDPPLPIGREPVTRLVPVDYDQEGDLDFVAAGPRRPSLFQNLGDRTFLDVSDASGLAAVGPTVAASAVDLDDDGDVDLVFVTRRGEVLPAVNVGGGRFTVRPPVADAPSGAFDLATGDLDGDGDIDFAVAAPRGVFLLEGRGGTEFRGTREPALAGAVRWPAAGAASVWIADLDADGLPDVLAAGETGGLLGLGTGGTGLLTASELLAPLGSRGAFPVALALVDDDTRIDLLASRGSCGLARNIGGGRDARTLRLVGVKSNRDAVGAIVTVSLGERTVRRDAGGGPVHVGGGDPAADDPIRVRWPTGLIQSVVDAPPGEETVVREATDENGSCPSVFAWDGERFRFVADVLTSARLGLPAGPGAYVPPGSREIIRIAGDAWRVDASGFLTLQLTEEHREVTYLDRVQLLAIDHPDSVEVEPGDSGRLPAAETDVPYAVLDGARRPIRAIDHAGRDVTDALQEVDDLVVADLPPTPVPGLAGLHVLELDFGDVPRDADLVLHLSGWLDRTDSSERLAIAQRPGAEPPALRIETATSGASWTSWPRAIPYPTGTTRSVGVDLTGAFPDGRARLRLATTLRLFWDRALLQIGSGPVAPPVAVALPDSADLHPRGRSEPILPIPADGPVRLDHDALRTTAIPWDPFDGRVTRVGEVSPLLQEADDLFVILAPGDECTLRFRADALPPLDAGTARTWLLVFDGWVKDGDPNTAFGGYVDPLPFRAMSHYPYRPDETYPEDERHRTYLAEWNTRSASDVGGESTESGDGGSVAVPGAPPPTGPAGSAPIDSSAAP